MRGGQVGGISIVRPVGVRREGPHAGERSLTGVIAFIVATFDKCNYRKLTLVPERRQNQDESLSDRAPPDSRNPHLRTPIPPAVAARKPDGLVTLDGVAG